MPKVTPHVCRHTYCSEKAKKGMNPNTLKYLMGHTDIGVTLNIFLLCFFFPSFTSFSFSCSLRADSTSSIPR